MGLRGWGRLAALMGAALLVSGCGGQTIPQKAVTQTQARQASIGYFTYVSGGCDGVCVLAYPTGDLVASIKLKGTKEGACSDGAGNVFITNDTQVVELPMAERRPLRLLLCRVVLQRTAQSTRLPEIWPSCLMPAVQVLVSFRTHLDRRRSTAPDSCRFMSVMMTLAICSPRAMAFRTPPAFLS